MKDNILKLHNDEKTHIVNFINDYANENEPICVFVSGGLDSDVVARLCFEAVGRERMRLVFVLQDGMENKYRYNAYQLSEDLKIAIDEIDLRGFNTMLIEAAEKGNSSLFDSCSLLDPNRAKCSLRTALISCYQDKGFLIAGTSNRTETELGFFLPFGDNISHFKPIAHLYKTQVILLARELKCRSEVINQLPSAGFWEGQEDLTDLAYWIINRAPIMGKGRNFSDDEDKRMKMIREGLTQKAVDTALYAIYNGYTEDMIADISGLESETVTGLCSIVKEAKKWKNRPILKNLTIN